MKHGFDSRTDYQKPLRASGFFYFTVVVAGMVAN